VAFGGERGHLLGWQVIEVVALQLESNHPVEVVSEPEFEWQEQVVERFQNDLAVWLLWHCAH